MLRSLRWFWRWYRRRSGQMKLLVALLIIATFMGCFGILTPSLSTSRPAATPVPTVQGR